MPQSLRASSRPPQDLRSLPSPEPLPPTTDLPRECRATEGIAGVGRGKCRQRRKPLRPALHHQDAARRDGVAARTIAHILPVMREGEHVKPIGIIGMNEDLMNSATEQENG